MLLGGPVRQCSAASRCQQGSGGQGRLEGASQQQAPSSKAEMAQGLVIGPHKVVEATI